MLHSPIPAIGLSIVAVLLAGFAWSADDPFSGRKPTPLPTIKAFPPRLPLGLKEAPVIVDHKNLDDFVGRVVVVRGRICRGKITDILGVEVIARMEDTEEARNRDFCAVGILVKHEEPPKRQEPPRTGERLTVKGIATGGFRSYSLYTDFVGRHAEAIEIIGETPPPIDK